MKKGKAYHRAWLLSTREMNLRRECKVFDDMEGIELKSRREKLDIYI